MNGHSGARAETRAIDWGKAAELAGAILAWAWFIVAGCGGLGLIITEGPWPPTHGWFALFSGLAVWPVTAWVCKKYLRVALSGAMRLGTAALFLLAGRLALVFLWPPPTRPVNQPDWIAVVCGTILLITILTSAMANSKRPD